MYVYIPKYIQIFIIYTNSWLDTHIIAYCTKCLSFPNYKFYVQKYHIWYIVVNLAMNTAKLGVHIINKSRMIPWFCRTHFCECGGQYFNIKFVCEVTLLGKYERTHLQSFIPKLNTPIPNISIWWIINISINKYNIFVCIYTKIYTNIHNIHQ